MIPKEQKAPPGDRTAAEWNDVANATRRRRRILQSRILFSVGKRLQEKRQSVTIEKGNNERGWQDPLCIQAVPSVAAWIQKRKEKKKAYGCRKASADFGGVCCFCKLY